MGQTRQTGRFAMAGVLALALVVAACGGDDTDSVESASGSTTTFALDDSDLVAGEEVPIEVDGWEPLSTVTITMYSDPVELGTTDADESGSISTSVEVPVGAEAGDHELELAGEAPGGARRVLTTAIVIATAEQMTTTTTSPSSSTSPPSSAATSSTTSAPATTATPTTTTTQPPTTTTALPAGTAPRLFDRNGEITTYEVEDCGATDWRIEDPEGGPWTVEIIEAPIHGTVTLLDREPDWVNVYSYYRRSESAKYDNAQDHVTIRVSDGTRSTDYRLPIAYVAPPEQTTTTATGGPAPC